MRQQDRIIVWPVYFDSVKTRSEGRRVSKNLGVPSPKALEVKEASEKLVWQVSLFLTCVIPRHLG